MIHSAKTYPYKNKADPEKWHDENLLQETWHCIEESGHTPSDIVCICKTELYWDDKPDEVETCTWDEFKELADRTYDSGFGGNEVEHSLRIVFSDGQQMERWEYDGSEGWTYFEPFKMPENPTKMTTVFEEKIYFTQWD